MHPENKLFSIYTVERGRMMDFSREHPEKAPTPTCVTLSGTVTETKFVQLEHVSNTIDGQPNKWKNISIPTKAEIIRDRSSKRQSRTQSSCTSPESRGASRDFGLQGSGGVTLKYSGSSNTSN